MATNADRLRRVSEPKPGRLTGAAGRRAALRLGAVATVLALFGCGYRPRVRLEGGSKGVDEWRVGLPF